MTGGSWHGVDGWRELVLARVTEAKREGQWHVARCPIHGGHSLRIGEIDGTPAITCMAECDSRQVLTALGLAWADIATTGHARPATRNPSRTGPGRAELNQLADYVAECARRLPGRAELLDRFGLDVDDAAELDLGVDPGPSAAITRPAFITKTFHRVPRLVVPFRNAAGELVGLQGRATADDPVRWCSPFGKWAAAAWWHHWGDPTGPVVVTEGPGDALTVLAAGLPAVAVSGTAHKDDAIVDELVAGLAGRTVVLASDCDGAGQKWTATLGARLAERGITVHPVIWPAGTPHKGDVNQYVRSGGHVEELVAQALAAPALPIPAETDRIELTDTANAARLARRITGRFLYVPARGAWYQYDGTRWLIDTHGAIVEEAKAVAADLLTEAADVSDADDRKAATRWATSSAQRVRLEAMIALARSIPGVPVDIDDFDPDPYALNTTSGTVDMRTGELRPHDPADRITKLAPVPYDPHATAPRWLRFLERILPDPDVRDFVQLAAGYSSTGDVSEHKLLIAYGAGANGKSVFMDTVAHVLGEYATTADAELLLDHRDQHPTGIARLVGARFVRADETDDGRRLAEGRVKWLTGGDRLSARFMFRDFFEFRPSHTLWLVTNHRPNVRGTDHGLWRRLRIIPFEVTIPEDERDRHLAAKLADEAPGILRWLVDGAHRWHTAGGLTEPSAVLLATDVYRLENDTVAEFLGDTCRTGADQTARASDVFTAYTEWCRATGEQPQSQKWLGARLVEKGYSRERRGGGSTGSKAWFWRGLAVIREYEVANP